MTLILCRGPIAVQILVFAVCLYRNRNRNLEISKAPTKAKSREPAYPQAKCISLSVYLSVRPSVYSYVPLSVFLSACLSVEKLDITDYKKEVFRDSFA